MAPTPSGPSATPTGLAASWRNSLTIPRCVRLYRAHSGAQAAQFCHWSAAELPLRARCVDVCVVDLPFGQTHKIKGGGSRNLYPRATLEAARVLRPGGRFVALTPALRVLSDCLEQQGELWAHVESRQINCGGILAWVCVWTRSHSAHDATTAVLAASVPKRPAGSATRAQRTSTDAFFYYSRGLTLRPLAVPFCRAGKTSDPSNMSSRDDASEEGRSRNSCV